MSQEFDTPLWSHLLTARAFNFTASKCVHAHTHTHANTHIHACLVPSFKAARLIIGGKQPNSALHALFSVFL